MKLTGDERIHDDRRGLRFHYRWWPGGGAAGHRGLTHCTALILLEEENTPHHHHHHHHHLHAAPHLQVEAVSHLSQMSELPVRYDWSSPQVVDADVMRGRGHGGLQVVVIAEGPSGHPDGKLHPAHPRTLDGCRHKRRRRLNNSFLLTSCYWRRSESVS